MGYLEPFSLSDLKKAKLALLSLINADLEFCTFTAKEAIGSHRFFEQLAIDAKVCYFRNIASSVQDEKKIACNH